MTTPSTQPSAGVPHNLAVVALPRVAGSDAPRAGVQQSTLLGDLVERFRVEMRRLYDPQLPYHNWDHAVQVHDKAMKLADLCESFGMTVKREALACACLGHDALFVIRPSVLKHATKEDVACQVIANTLLEMGAPKWFADEVQGIIVATKHGVAPLTIEQKIIRAADLGNVGGDYAQFRENTTRLFEEAKYLNEVTDSLATWTPKCLNFLAEFVWPFIQLTPAALDERNVSAWHTKAMANVRELLLEVQGPAAEFKVIGAVGPAVSFLTHRGARPHELVVAFESEEQMRQRAFSQSRQLLPSLPPSSVVMFAPGSVRGMPLTPNYCDEFYLGVERREDMQDLGEVKRVLKPGGTLTLDIPRRFGLDASAIATVLEEMGFEILSLRDFTAEVERIEAQRRKSHFAS